MEKEIDVIKTTKRWLAELEQNRQACISLRSMLECMDGLQGVRYNGMPSHGKIGDPTLELVAKKLELELRLKNTERIVKLIEDALDTLTEAERIIVIKKYIMGLSWGRIVTECHYSRSWVYDHGNKALKKVSKALFGENTGLFQDK